MVSRTVRTPFGDWWWTVDRAVLAALFGLMLGGIILSLAASPPVAARLNLDAFHFVNRHILFLAPTVVVLLTTSFLSPRQIRRVALVVFLVSLLLVAVTPFFGAEIKGARRWLVIFGVNVQPSEFLKPAFVILIAWLFGESTRRPEMPANTAALALLLDGRDAAGDAARLRPDHADRAGLGRAVLHGRHAAHLGRRPRRARRRGPRRRLFHRAARRAAHPALHGPRLGRHLQHRSRAGKLRARRLVRPRPGRGHRQAHPAGEPHRLRLRGRRRGVRHRALPDAAGAVRLHRDPLAAARAAQRRSVHRALPRRGSRSCSACNRPSTWRSTCT